MQAESYLCNFFDIEPPPVAEWPNNGATTGDKGQGHDSHDLTPETQDTADGPRLTALGRYQVGSKVVYFLFTSDNFRCGLCDRL